jgi:hypothetical protein
MTTQRLDPATRLVRSLDGEYYKLVEAAEMLGIGSSTLRKYISTGNKEMSPSKQINYLDKVRIYLYTAEDIERMREYLGSMSSVQEFDGPMRPRGRPRKYSDEQRRERMRLFAKASYWRRRASDLSAVGKHEEAVKALRKESALREALKNGE